MEQFSYSELSNIQTIVFEHLIDYQNTLENYKDKPDSGMYRIAKRKFETSSVLLKKIEERMKEYFKN